MNNEVLVKAENVSKKFCRDLKRSLWYGVKDIASEIVGAKNNGQLRKDEFWAVKDVSFELRRGECLGLIGHNGAGKSTLLKLLNGLIKPDKGKITMKGRIGSLIELGAGFNPILTGRENIYNNGAVLGFSKKEIAAKFDAIVDFSEIGEFIDMPVQNYSSGMKVRLGFAVAAQMEPDVLIIDEVLAVGDVGFRTKCFNRINELLAKSSVIFVSHQMSQIGRISSNIFLMKGGCEEYYGSDVPYGINSYFGNFKSKYTNKSIIGSGQVRIENLTINQNRIENDIKQQHLDPFFIDFRIRYFKKIDKISIWYAFINKDLYTVAQSYSRLIEYTNDEILVSCKIDKLLLSPGKYSLAVRILKNEKSEIIFGQDFQDIIQIEGEINSNASILFDSHWKIK